MSRIHNQLADVQKKQFIAKLREGKSCSQVFTEMAIPLFTTLKRPGRPKLEKEKRDLIIKCVKDSPSIKKVQISRLVGVSIATIKKILTEENESQTFQEI